MATETTKVPAKALTWTTEFQLGDNGEESKTAPFEMVARSGKPINHWYFGQIVHDLEGMGHKGRVPIDYAHDDNEVIGYANKFSTESGDLTVSGALVPFKESDKATEVIHKQKAGVPYEASIFFSDPKMERLDEGVTTEVNGREFTGPGIVVRKWTLRGIAVCPYGCDPNTSTKFSSSDQEIEVEMSTKTKVEDCKFTSDNPEAKAVEGSDADQAVELSETPDNVEAHSDEAEAMTDDQPVTALSDGQRFLDAFGDQGGVWFAQGKSFEEAQQLHSQALSDENEELKKKLSALEAGAGEETPVSFSATDEERKKKQSLAGLFAKK